MSDVDEAAGPSSAHELDEPDEPATPASPDPAAPTAPPAPPTPERPLDDDAVPATAAPPAEAEAEAEATTAAEEDDAAVEPAPSSAFDPPPAAWPQAGSARRERTGGGPMISFGFNLGKIPDQGEDSDPIVRTGRDLALVAVFDGMGGAGGTVYETPDGPRTGAYLASRVARDVVEEVMLDAMEPQWHLDGRRAAQLVRDTVKDALVERLRDLDAPVSKLRSKLLRALPTT